MSLAVRKPYAFLMASFALLLKLSATPAEISPFARKQLISGSSCTRSDCAIFFIGSMFDLDPECRPLHRIIPHNLFVDKRLVTLDMIEDSL